MQTTIDTNWDPRRDSGNDGYLIGGRHETTPSVVVILPPDVLGDYELAGRQLHMLE